jgi:hypothetical protein
LPVTPNQKSLARVGVTLVSDAPIELKCKTCGAEWQPGQLSSGRLPQGWWKCPNDPRHTVDWDSMPNKVEHISKSEGTEDLDKRASHP